MTHKEARQLLGRLGVESWQVLDICFLAHSVAGLLVYVQYKGALIDLLIVSKILVLADFDPFDPAHLADPQHPDKPNSIRGQELAWVVMNRSAVALERLRYPVAVSVGRFFVENAFVIDELLSEILNSKPDRPHYARHRDDPHQDTVMLDSSERRHSVASAQKLL